MSRTHRSLFVSGLLLVSAGIVLGFAHGWLVHHETLLVLREQYRTAWTTPAATPGKSHLGDALENAKQMNYRYVRVVDAHTHLIKLGSVLLLVALLHPLIALSEGTKRVLSAVFVVGSVLFPIGVLAEISVPGRWSQSLAAAGALLVIAAFAGMLRGLLRGVHQVSQGTDC